MAYETAPEPADKNNVLLYKIARGIWGLFTGTGTAIPVTPGGGAARTFALVAAVGNGTVAAGAKSVAFSSSSDFEGTIAGATFGASQTTGASVDGADTIGAITYTRAAGTLYIATVT